MNERIFELKNDALDWAMDNLDPDLNDYEWEKEIDKKFAELIIKECAGILFDESERLYAYATECDNIRESDEAEVVAEKCVDLITMIEEHFGVEE